MMKKVNNNNIYIMIFIIFTITLSGCSSSYNDCKRDCLNIKGYSIFLDNSCKGYVGNNESHLFMNTSDIKYAPYLKCREEYFNRMNKINEDCFKECTLNNVIN